MQTLGRDAAGVYGFLVDGIWPYARGSLFSANEPLIIGNTLHHTAAHCSTLHHTATYCNTLQYTATQCLTLPHPAAFCSTLGGLSHILLIIKRSTHRILHISTTYCNTVPHTATRYNSRTSLSKILLQGGEDS